MPRFYFDSQDGSFFRDEDGTDCSDLSEAKGVAARFVRELAYDAPPKMPFEVSVIVRDERGENIAVASAKFEMRDQSPASPSQLSRYRMRNNNRVWLLRYWSRWLFVVNPSSKGREPKQAPGGLLRFSLH